MPGDRDAASRVDDQLLIPFRQFFSWSKSDFEHPPKNDEQPKESPRNEFDGDKVILYLCFENFVEASSPFHWMM